MFQFSSLIEIFFPYINLMSISFHLSDDSARRFGHFEKFVLDLKYLLYIYSNPVSILKELMYTGSKTSLKNFINNIKTIIFILFLNKSIRNR
jgi:hypothetical protein